MNRLHARAVGAVVLTVGAVLLAACTGTVDSDAPAPSLTSPAKGPGSGVAADPSLEGGLAPAIESWRGKRDTRKNVRAILVSEDGRTVFENYYGTTPDVARDMESVTKSVISTLVGAAIAGRDIRSVDQTLSELLPSYASTMRPAVAAVTLRQLLTMTAGVPDWTEQTAPSATKAPDWVAATLTSMSPTTNSRFVYSNGDAHLIAAILKQATGRSVLDFAREVLFNPLGIDTSSAIEPLAVPSNFGAYAAAKFAWPVDPQHLNLGFSLLTLRPEDMLKIGQLYLDSGRWKGKQLLPAKWITDATTAQIKTYETWDSYGYLWWVTTADQEPAYAAVGAGGQIIEVVPSRGLVVVATSEYDAVNPSNTAEDPFDLTLLVNDVIAPSLS
jgi:CubicO group peptidase (beta-lactamase class C family)